LTLTFLTPTFIVGIAAAIMLLAGMAEWLHARRCRKMASLAFGPAGEPHQWTKTLPFLRPVCLALITWGLLTLLQLNPKVFAAQELSESKYRHVVLVYDVSPSMKLKDAGMQRKQKRSDRASIVVKSIMNRIALDQVKFSVVAVYSGARPVVIDTQDPAVIYNILDDLPMEFAFDHGKTILLDGLRETAKVAQDWPPDSTTIIIVSDGDTVPDSGIPSMPRSVANVMVIGVGDSRHGIFIDGHQSRQDSSTLRQLARRMGGVYHDGNEKHVTTESLNQLSSAIPMKKDTTRGMREYALLSVIAGALLWAMIPLGLEYGGSTWHATR
jgi:Ca-activated chloride channel family protein